MLRIKELRNAQGKTLLDMSKATAISVASLSRYENGEQVPSIERAFDISSALGVTLNDLYVHEDEAATASSPRG